MLNEWKAISNRISALRESALLFGQMTAGNSNDSFGTAKILITEGKSIFLQVSEFVVTFDDRLPQFIKSAITGFSTKHASKFPETTDDASARELAMVKIVALSSINAEVNFGFADTQANVRRHSERAFIHLQRSIVADPAIQKLWHTAFEKNEVACEKLGAAQLLLHGIWAFKTDSAGAKTDLIFGERITDLSDIERSTDGLVLTEWKLARKGSDIAAMFDAARVQADKYAGGILAGFELRAYRFLVVVSEHGGAPVPDITESGVTYRHIHLAVSPKTPSKR